MMPDYEKWTHGTNLKNDYVPGNVSNNTVEEVQSHIKRSFLWWNVTVILFIVLKKIKLSPFFQTSIGQNNRNITDILDSFC